MKDIQLKNGRTIEPHYGKNVDTLPGLLTRYDKGEGFIPSEADIRLLGIINFKNAPEIADNYWDTSTLSATKGEIVKVILPYKTGSRTLTDSARFGLDLINSDEELVHYGVNLDIDDRWKKLKGSGVYTFQRKGLILGRHLTETKAMEHELILTKLGHPSHVDPEFWMYKGEKNKSIDGVQNLIRDTFKLGKREYGNNMMMNQYLPNVSDKGILSVWYVNGFDYWMGSDAGSCFYDDCGCFGFDSMNKARSQSLEEKPRAA